MIEHETAEPGVVCEKDPLLFCGEREDSIVIDRPCELSSGHRNIVTECFEEIAESSLKALVDKNFKKRAGDALPESSHLRSRDRRHTRRMRARPRR